jgi:hypothetical protein
MLNTKINKKDNKDLFTTYNLNFSAVLVAGGFKLQQVDKGLGPKALFCFENTVKLQSVSDKYWRKELKIEPQLLFDSLKFLKNRLYSDLENNDGF